MTIQADPVIPPADTTRWTAGRKAGLVAAIKCGLISTATACKRYRLSAEELEEWQKSYADDGINGLKVTKRPRRHT